MQLEAQVWGLLRAAQGPRGQMIIPHRWGSLSGNCSSWTEWPRPGSALPTGSPLPQSTAAALTARSQAGAGTTWA